MVVLCRAWQVVQVQPVAITHFDHFFEYGDLVFLPDAPTHSNTNTVAIPIQRLVLRVGDAVLKGHLV